MAVFHVGVTDVVDERQDSVFAVAEGSAKVNLVEQEMKLKKVRLGSFSGFLKTCEFLKFLTTQLWNDLVRKL